MLSDLSPEEFDAFQAALAYAQALESRAMREDGVRLKLATLPGQRMSYAEIAEWFDTTPQDIRLTEAAALEKLRNIPAAYELFLEVFTANPAP